MNDQVAHEIDTSTVASPLQKDTLQALLIEVRNLERQHALKSRSRRIGHHLQPLIAFVDRYARAVDVAAQGCPNPASVIWSLLRALLVVAQNYTQYFENVVITLSRLGSIVAVYSQYEEFVGNSPAFQQCLSLVYTDIMEFLKKSRKILNRSGLAMWFQCIWRDFEAEFRETLAALSLHTKALRDQATLTYRHELYKAVKTQMHSYSKLTNELHVASETDKREAIFKWLASPSMYLHRVNEAFKKPDGSGQWFFATAQFCSWRMSSRKALLWVNAPPGTGKSILSTCIVEELSKTLKDSEYLCSFFFQKDDPAANSLNNILSAFLHQLSTRRDNVPPMVTAAYSKSSQFGNKQISDADNPLELLKQVLSSVDRTFIVLDGVDESPEAFKIVSDLSEVVTSTQKCCLLILSRDVPEVRRGMPGFTVELQLTPTQTNRDLHAYISQAIGKSDLGPFDPMLEARITQKLQADSHGNFLWASHMLQSLQSATTPLEADCLMSRMPAGLQLVYEKDVQRLISKGSQRCNIFIHASRWLLCSLRPLSVTELSAALAIDIVHSSFEPSRKPFPNVLKDTLSPFFIFDRTSDTFRPIHWCISDFFLARHNNCNVDDVTKQFFADTGHNNELIGQECLLLLNSALRPGHTEHAASNEPLTRYACLYWPDHVIRSASKNSMWKSVADFLLSDCRRPWISHFLIGQPGIFPLQRLFRLQTRLQAWLPPSLDIDLYAYLDWVPDVAAMLLDIGLRPKHLDLGGRAKGPSKGKTQLSHFDRIMIVRDLSRQLTATNRLSFGIKLFDSALHDREKAHGVSNLDLVWLWNALGILYDQQGQFSEATQIQEHAITSLSRESHDLIPEAYWTRNELGRMYRHQNRLEEAVEMHTGALAILKSITQDPNSDLEIAWTLATVARAYRKQQRFDEAISHSQQALDIRQPLQGQDHPHCLWLLSDIAQCHFEKGDFDVAIRYHRDVYHGRQIVLGPEHPDTLWTMNNLAVSLAKTGHEGVSEALRLQKQAWESQRKFLGSEHPHTRWTAAVIETLEQPEQSICKEVNSPTCSDQKTVTEGICAGR